MKNFFGIIFVLIILLISAKEANAQFYSMTGDQGSKWAQGMNELSNTQKGFNDLLESLVGKAEKYYFVKENSGTMLVVVQSSGVLFYPFGKSGSEAADSIVGKISEDKIEEAKAAGIYICNVAKENNIYKAVNCKGSDFFTWSETYGSADNPGYEKKVWESAGETLNLKMEVDNNSGRWYAQFWSSIDPKVDKFVKLTQNKVAWTIESTGESGKDHNGKADLEVKTKLDSGETLPPGLYNLKFIVKQDLNPVGVKYIKEETKSVFLKVVYNCAKAIEGKDCSDPTQLEGCKKACPTKYCEFDGKSCVNKKDGVTSDGTSGPGLSGMQYNPEYFKKINPKPEGYVGALPDCAFSGTCRDANDLVQLIINFGQGMFAILGTFAFVFFVYGGFTIILSMGNAEKVNKGKQILGAAVVGLVVAFCAYLLIDFMLEALQVKDTFKGI